MYLLKIKFEADINSFSIYSQLSYKPVRYVDVIETNHKSTFKYEER